MRWHKLLHGRITQSLDCHDGDEAERRLRPTTRELIVSNEDWLALHHKRALRHHGAPISTPADIIARMKA